MIRCHHYHHEQTIATAYASRPEEAAAEIAKVADALHRFGALVIKDPRVEEQQNTAFVDMMEKYADYSPH